MRKLLGLALVITMATAGCGGKREQSQTSTAKAPATVTVGGKTATMAPSETPAAGESGVGVGSTMPEYSATTFDGKKWELSSERGNVVLLNLWATWCGPCRFEIPELQKIHDANASRGFKVVGVSLDDGGADVVKQFVAEHKMTYPVLLDPDGKLANVFQTSVVPTTVLIDRKGKVVWKQLGAISESDVKQEIEKALNAKG